MVRARRGVYYCRDVVKVTVNSVSAEESDNKRQQKRRGKAEAQLASGLTFTAVFGGLLLLHGGWYWIFPMAFAGVLPAVQAALTLRRRGRLRPPAAAAVDPQKEVLRIARNYRGRVTASIVALDTPLSIAESERALDELARNGHASLTVSEDGRVAYEFREFLPAIEPDRAELDERDSSA